MPNCARATRFVVFCVLFSALTACGSDECKRGSTECVSDQLIRTCVPSDGDNQWLVSQCSPTTTCISQPSLVISVGYPDEDDAGVAQPRAAPGSIPQQPACIGTCEIGAHECVSDALARYCVDGGSWQLDACNVGERCNKDKGVCALATTGAVQACKPGAKACAGDAVAKVCESDGSAWLEQPCAAGQACTGGTCKADPKSSCDNGDSCLDNKTAIRCLGQAQGYKLQTCDGDLYCEDGRCRGSVCAVGASCIGSNQRRECVSGTGYKDSQCAVNEICEQNQDEASCVPLQCKVGSSSCGDPRDSGVDKQHNFTTCVNGLSSGVPEWVKGQCSGATTCNPMLANTSNPCSQDCTPRAQRCASDPLVGVNDGYQECGDDAKWGQIHTCNKGADTQLMCAVAPNPDASQLPKALCVTPICQWIWANPMAGATGACDGDKLQKCNADGTLANASACDAGVCSTLRNTVVADGRAPGACSETSAECRDDEQLCIEANGAVTPRYRSCLNGKWSTELMTCDNDASCYTLKDTDGLRRVLCGAQCSPGSRRCNDAGQLEQCDAGGHYSEGMPCSMGTCHGLDNNDAACVLECVPSSHVCTGATTIAADGYHTGTSQEFVCGNDGRKGDAHDCSSGKLCRVTETGVALGCVDCIGTGAPGGNSEGTTDSRCDPGDGNRVQECTDQNTWDSGRMCSGTKTCVKPGAGTCGNCMGGNGSMLQCSEAKLSADKGGTSCESLGYGSPGAWGGVTDCCANYRVGDASSFAYCK